MDSERLSDFIKQYLPEREAFLEDLRKTAEENNVPIIREETESFIKAMITLIRPSRILELGTATGYSALMMAAAASKEGIGLFVIDTIEDWEPRISEARINIKNAGFDSVINLIKGDALQVMKTLKEAYDLIFIDAAKGQYPDYLEEAMRLTRKGSVILADNILQGGEIMESKFIVERRDRTIHKRIREFLDRIYSDERLNTSMIPVGDGLTFSVRCI